ncbi:hypothetical protein CULT_1570007 [[Clostridium] ultunense Esp]|nr:hypothetical protein CULT_1570007 [[Clostridium] ultunense Esp]
MWIIWIESVLEIESGGSTDRSTKERWPLRRGKELEHLGRVKRGSLFLCCKDISRSKVTGRKRSRLNAPVLSPR